MTGLRARTTGSIDRQFDTYATIGHDKVRIIAGVRLVTGNYSNRGGKSGCCALTKAGFIDLKIWKYIGTSV